MTVNTPVDKLTYSFESDVKVGWESWFDSAVKRCIHSPDFASFRLAVDMLEAFISGYKLKSSTADKNISIINKKYPEAITTYFKRVDSETDSLIQNYGNKDNRVITELYKYKFILLLSLIQSISPEKVVVNV